MKSYTDIEQSKKLAKILPLESADMKFYYNHMICDYEERPYVGSRNYDECSAIPCWSLAALFSVLPMIDFTPPQLVGTPKTLYRCMYDDNLKSHACDNPVDACVAMIENLHELKML